MITHNGYGRGYAYVNGNGHGDGDYSMYEFERGDGHHIFNTLRHTEGSGAGDGKRYAGHMTGDGYGFGSARGSQYVTALLIDRDPLTMSYQFVTMQTIGEHHA